VAWYWIVLLISLIVGPFEALYVCNKAWKNRKKRQESARQAMAPAEGEEKKQ